jgi:hypothetical protein
MIESTIRPINTALSAKLLYTWNAILAIPGGPTIHPRELKGVEALAVWIAMRISLD